MTTRSFFDVLLLTFSYWDVNEIDFFLLVKCSYSKRNHRLAHGDMKFRFLCATRYLTRELFSHPFFLPRWTLPTITIYEACLIILKLTYVLSCMWLYCDTFVPGWSLPHRLPWKEEIWWSRQFQTQHTQPSVWQVSRTLSEGYRFAHA